eukprot:gene26775-4358_t
MTDRAGAGSLGPRLIGRLTAELILRSPQYMNCVSQYEVNLRGNKISAIENLGATENQFDCLDLSDNAIVKLEGFPKLPRLKQVLLSNNRISKIAKQLEAAIPNLETLVLTNNRVANLQDLDPLATCPNLTLVSLLGNPVTTKHQYRLYVISKLKHLKVLDFKKVKLQERAEAEKLFPDAKSAEKHSANTFEPEEDLAAATEAQEATAKKAQAAALEAAVAKAKAAGPTPDQIIAVKAAIAAATTLEEVSRLEAALTSGHLPSDYNVDGKVQAEQPEQMEVG